MINNCTEITLSCVQFPSADDLGSKVKEPEPWSGKSETMYKCGCPQTHLKQGSRWRWKLGRQARKQDCGWKMTEVGKSATGGRGSPRLQPTVPLQGLQGRLESLYTRAMATQRLLPSVLNPFAQAQKEPETGSQQSAHPTGHS